MSDAQTSEAAEPSEPGGAGTTAADDSADEHDDDGGEGATVAAVKPPDKSADPEEERLQKLGEQIRHASQQAEEAIGEPGQKFYESGNDRSEAQDDQTIVPPG